MTEERPVADTALARWLNDRMNEWEDPKSGRAGLSINKIARLSGVPQTTIFEILKEGKTPKADSLVGLADFFDTSPMVVFRLAYAPETEESDFPPEIKARFTHLEQLLSKLPTDIQMQLLDNLVSTAEMQMVAMDRLRATQEERG